MDGASSWQVLRRVFLPSTVPAIVTVALFAFIMSWNEFLGALVMMSRSSTLHPAADPGRGPDRDQPRRHRLGHAPGRHHHLDHPVCPRLPAAAAVLRVRPDERSGEMSTEYGVARRDGKVPAAAARGRRRLQIVDGFWAERLRINRRAHHPARLRPAAARAERWTTCAWRPAATGDYRALADTAGVDLPLPRLRRLQVARGGGLGARPRRRTPAWPRPPTRRSRVVAAAQRPDGYLNSYVQVVGGGSAAQRPRLGPRVLLHRPPDPGGGRLAPRARRRPAPGHRGPGRRPDRPRVRARRARPGRRASRASRWRWSS